VEHLSVSPLLALLANIRLMMERLARIKHSSLLRILIKYSRKIFIALGPGTNVLKL
jgi:hypothetical protein